MKILGQGFQKLEHEQDTHTETDAHILTDASESITMHFVGGNKKYRKQSKQDFLGHDWLDRRPTIGNFYVKFG